VLHFLARDASLLPFLETKAFYLLQNNETKSIARIATVTSLSGRHLAKSIFQFLLQRIDNHGSVPIAVEHALWGVVKAITRKTLCIKKSHVESSSAGRLKYMGIRSAVIELQMMYQ
jgi:hypothetical protein